MNPNLPYTPSHRTHQLIQHYLPVGSDQDRQSLVVLVDAIKRQAAAQLNESSWTPTNYLNALREVISELQQDEAIVQTYGDNLKRTLDLLEQDSRLYWFDLTQEIKQHGYDQPAAANSAWAELKTRKLDPTTHLSTSDPVYGSPWSVDNPY